MLRHIRLLILDLDYLVFDCAQLKTQAVRQSMISLADMVPHHVSLPEVADAEAGYREYGSKWAKHLDIGFDQQCLDDLDRAYELHETRLVEAGAGRLYPGIEAFLHSCINDGVSLALGADANRDYLIAILERYHLDNLFQIAVCTEEFGKGGADEMMLEIIRQIEVNPSETLMMGTRPHTFQAARAVDIMSIGCGWGITQPEALSGADLQSRAIPELNSLIKNADALAFQNQEQ